jgi:hypothetical protein
MSLLGLAVAVFLSQSPNPSATPPLESTSSERTAAAAERTAIAAEATAAAAGRIAEALAGPKAAPGAPSGETKPEHWRGTAGLGLTFLSGNAEALTLTGTVAGDRKWSRWAMALRASGAYGVSNPTANLADSTGQTTARRAGATARGDRSLGAFASLFVLGGFEFDHIKNVEARGFGEAGTGLTFLDEKRGDLERLFLRLDLALRAGYETRLQYFPAVLRVDPYGVAILAPRAAATFRWALSRDVRVSEELEFIPFLLRGSAGRLLINNTTKLSARLTESVSLTTALVLNYDSAPPQAPSPAPEKRSTDVAVTAGIEAAF